MFNQDFPPRIVPMGFLRRATAFSVLCAAMIVATIALPGCISVTLTGDHSTPEAPRSHLAITAVLDSLHTAAANADEEFYFGLYAPEAIFLGTDASERWTLGEFHDWARPYFQGDSAWVYRVLERHITVAPSGSVAWFDERLENDRLGECRGSGALRLINGRWRITQYNLTIPIPNDLADEVVGLIRAEQTE